MSWRKRNAIKTYTFGSRIDPSKPLAVRSLPRGHWGDLEAAYPELARLKKDVPWRAPNAAFTIQPPEEHDVLFLRVVARVNDETHRSFPLIERVGDRRRLRAVLQMVYTKEGAQLHIFRRAD